MISRRIKALLTLGLLAFFACAPAKVAVVPDKLQKQKDDAILAFNQGVELLRGRRADYYKAVEKLTAAVRLDPRLYQAQFDLGLLYARGNDLPNSQAAYRAALAVRPADRAATFNLADVYRKNKKYDRAIEILEKFVADNPKDFEARNNLSVLLRLKGEYDKAMQQARYVLERDPGQVLAYNNLATIFSEKGEHEMARDLFRRALSLDPDNSRVLNNKGLALLKEKSIQEALELFLKAFKKGQNLPEAGLNAASVYMDSGDYARAASMYKRIVQAIPGFLPALVGHAVATRGLGRFARAEKSYQQILGLDHTNPDTLFNLGLLYMNYRKKPDWACEAFQRYLKSGRTDPVHVKRARGFLEDIRLSNPGACKGGSK